MGVGISVVALHRIHYLDVDKAASHVPSPGTHPSVTIIPGLRIRGVYPAALAWDSSRQWPENDALAAAWQASETVWRLCNLAIQHRVPLHYSG